VLPNFVKYISIMSEHFRIILFKKLTTKLTVYNFALQLVIRIVNLFFTAIFGFVFKSS